MIYRRPIREVVEERHGRTCGIHVFVFYMLALAAVLGMSAACLSATDHGFFVFNQKISIRSREQKFTSRIHVDYETTYGWNSMCSEATGRYKMNEYNGQGCFHLGETPLLAELQDIVLAAGSAMTEDTGMAVALGHGVAAAVAAVHLFFFLMLYFNVDPVPVRGYPYMRGLGLMSALSSFYLLFTCVVSFYFAVKGSLDVHMETSAGLRPSWAYVLTVINVTTMVVVGMMACQDDEVDAAIATPQYTSSSRNEDTVKRASGKLLHLRSKSSDTICDGMPSSLSQPATTTTSAPKVTVTSRQHPSASSALNGSGAGAGTLGGAGVPAGSTSRMSAAAASAAAHAASAFGRLAGSPVPSASAMSGWTGRVSGLSPLRRRDDQGSSGDMDNSNPAGVLDVVNRGEGVDVENGGGSGAVVERSDERARDHSFMPDVYTSGRTVLMGPAFYSGAGAAVGREMELSSEEGRGGAGTTVQVVPQSPLALSGVELLRRAEAAVDMEAACLEDDRKAGTELDESRDRAAATSVVETAVEQRVVLGSGSDDSALNPALMREGLPLLMPSSPVGGGAGAGDAVADRKYEEENSSSSGSSIDSAGRGHELEAGIAGLVVETSPIVKSAAVTPFSLTGGKAASNGAAVAAAGTEMGTGTVPRRVPGPVLASSDLESRAMDADVIAAADDQPARDSTPADDSMCHEDGCGQEDVSSIA